MPGISGSLVAISIGLYDKVLNIISSWENILKNKIYIIKVFIGFFLGLLLTARVLTYLFRYKEIIYYIISGIIISELPFIIKSIRIKFKFRIKLILFIFSFFFSLIIEYLNTRQIYISKDFNMFIGGVLFSFGKIFPGVSSSFFLLCLGIYEDLIILLLNPFLLLLNFHYYFPFIIGCLLGLSIFYKLLNFLICEKYEFFYSIILGLVLSSLILTIPRFEYSVDNIVGIILMFIIIIVFVRIKKKNKSQGIDK